MTYDSKPLSPNALADDEYLASVAKDLGTNEWKPPLPPQRAGITEKDLDRRLSKLAVTIGKAVRQMVVEPLQKKIAELEQKQLHMAGTYKAGQRYRQNGLVSFQGGLWLCLADTDTRPGGGSPAWRLAVKKGSAA